MSTLAERQRVQELERAVLEAMAAEHPQVKKVAIKQVEDDLGRPALLAALGIDEQPRDGWSVELWFALDQQVNRLAGDLGIDEWVQLRMLTLGEFDREARGEPAESDPDDGSARDPDGGR